jgi:4-amino-4-deoxy-L-arabinose transferase-like glycosyltransferase
MTERGDFVSLYWPGSPLDTDYFWSKPVLSFWLMSIAMHLAGIGGKGGRPRRWRCRRRPSGDPPALLPHALLALYGVYLVAARFVSRRAAVISVVALATFPCSRWWPARR